MSEGRVSEVVGQADRFGQGLIESQSPRDRSSDLSHFDAVCQTGAIVVIESGGKDLSLSLQATECGAMNDTIPISFEGGTIGMIFF